jgi:hypothetical protein
MMKLFGIGPNPGFRTRSIERMIIMDVERAKAISIAIERALSGASAERTGLSQRMENVLSQAAITGGNGVDEYLTRDLATTRILNDADDQIRIGHDRLRDLDQKIDHFKFLKIQVANRFPELNEAKLLAK